MIIWICSCYRPGSWHAPSQGRRETTLIGGGGGVFIEAAESVIFIKWPVTEFSLSLPEFPRFLKKFGVCVSPPPPQ